MQKDESEFQCSDCGADVQEGRPTCRNCGAKLEWDQADIEEPVERHCSACGASLSGEQMVCSHCGIIASEVERSRTLPTAGSEVSPSYASAHFRAGWAVALLALSALLSIACMYSNYLQLNLLEYWRRGGSILQADAIANDTRQGLLVMANGFVEMIAWTMFLVWLHRAYKNLIAMGLRELTFTPRSAVGRFFIPLLNITHAHRVLTELWKANDPEALDAASWKNSAGYWLITLWEAVLGIAVTVAIISTQPVQSPSQIDSLIVVTWVTMVVSGLTALGEILAMRLVNGIQKRQELKVIALAHMGPTAVSV